MRDKVQIITEVKALMKLFVNDNFKRGTFLNQILRNKAYLTLIMSDEDLNKQWANSESIIRLFCDALDLPKPKAEAKLIKYWENKSVMTEYNPMAIWLLDLDNSTIEAIKKNLGIWAVEAKQVSDLEFVFEHKKTYHGKNDVLGSTNNGWKNFILDAGKNLPVFNSLIIDDKFLIYTESNEHIRKNIDDGLENTLRLLDALLPNEIQEQIQILILCRHPNIEKEYVKEKIDEFIINAKALRPKYHKEIKIDFAFGVTPHGRNIYFNYSSFNADRGFNAFRPANTIKLNGENSFAVVSYLNNPFSTGDSNYKQAIESIKDIKEKCESILYDTDSEADASFADLNYVIFDPSTDDDSKINNRLFA